MQVVKGTADTLKKQQYLKMKAKVIEKDKLIDEAKQQVDQQIERKKQELAQKNMQIQQNNKKTTTAFDSNTEKLKSRLKEE